VLNQLEKRKVTACALQQVAARKEEGSMGACPAKTKVSVCEREIKRDLKV
jgi:hypothetical protein